VRARKHLGQNWLADPRYADRIVEAVDPLSTDLVLEIGPGPGALTDRLVPRASHTIAIELDPRMREPLEARHERDRLTVIEADVLETDLTELVANARAAHPTVERVRVAANLPYYISSAVLVHLIEHRSAFFDATLMLQKEVVERLVAPPGGKDYGSLTVFVAMYAEARRLFDVPPGAFRPAPKVTSSVIALRFRDRPAEEVPDESAFNRIVRAAFAQRRKTLGNCLAAGGFAGLAERAGIDPRRRAETLALAEFAALARARAAEAGPM
jgi:16S rRNA (adenine1518-N6/adenine1519-N6)-dimethyltransferase